MPVVFDEAYEPIARDREADRTRVEQLPGYLAARAQARRDAATFHKGMDPVLIRQQLVFR
jgi:hypothetical protein